MTDARRVGAMLDARRMPSEKIGGLSFNEIMTGQITLGQTDPVKGWAHPGAFAVSLHAYIDIEDIDAFFAKNIRRADFVARVSIPVLGGDFVGSEGDFILFNWPDTPLPTAPPRRSMAYSARLVRGEQTYHLRGRKYIEPGWPWQMWPATTTLRVRLHEVGSDGAAGPVIAAGVLRLSLGAFLRQMGTMRVSGGLSLAARIRVKLRYYWFFAWSLVKSYLFRRDW